MLENIKLSDVLFLDVETAPSLQAGNTYNGCSSADFSQLEFGTNSIGNNQSFIYRDYGLAMPTCSNGTLVTCFNPNPSDPDIPNPCPSYYTILSTITAIRDQYFITQGMATNSNTAYKNLLDGGNTEALLNEISTSTDLAALKSLLLSKSPYLSDAVLTQAIGREDTLSATAIKELVIANSPVTMSVLNAMKRRTYLSKINDSIAPYQTGISARSERENEADYYAFQANRATIQLKQAYLQTGNMDSLASISQKDSTLMGQLKLIGVLITDRDYATAQNVLNAIFTREGANISDRTKLSAMNLVLAQQGKSWFDLPDSLMTVVRQIYENHPLTAIHARSILALTQGLDYDRYPFDLGGGEEKRVALPLYSNSAQPIKNKMKIYPNPSNAVTTVEIFIEEGQTDKITIFNLLGIKLYEEVLKVGGNTIKIDNQNYDNGIYFYTLQDVNSSQVIDKQKVIISK